MLCSSAHTRSTCMRPHHAPHSVRFHNVHVAIGALKTRCDCFFHSLSLPSPFAQLCSRKGGTLAGVEDANQCFCGKTIASTAKQTPMSDCNMPCNAMGSKEASVYKCSSYFAISFCLFLFRIYPSSPSRHTNRVKRLTRARACVRMHPQKCGGNDRIAIYSFECSGSPVPEPKSVQTPLRNRKSA